MVRQRGYGIGVFRMRRTSNLRTAQESDQKIEDVRRVLRVVYHRRQHLIRGWCRLR